MTRHTDQKQTRPSTDKSNDLADNNKHLPDVIIDDAQPEAFDLPRKGIPKDVVNVSKAPARLPELLIDE